jgi:hypothetical protein
MHDDARTFAVCTFKRVFDTSPLKEVLTLSELVACLRRFEIKTEVRAKIDRELSRIDRALAQALAAETGTGERFAAIQAAGRGAKARGIEDPAFAMRAKAEEMRVHARASAKRELRLWSPALYREGDIERGSEGVTHLSCLVLDYDSGVRIEDALALWQDYFHCMHTTWSHTPEHPKFRVIFPLSVPVPAAQWETLWRWAEQRGAGEFDRAMKGVGVTYALPAVAHLGQARDAVTHAGPLLDPREIGIDVGEPLRLAVKHAPNSPMLGDPAKQYVVHETIETVYVYDDPAGDDPDWLDAPPPPIPNEVTAPVATPKSSRKRHTICVDFDGVLHSYTSPWKGATVIPDAPVASAIEWLTHIHDDYDVAIFSTRAREAGGISAMRQWLLDHGLDEAILERISFPREKPLARVYIDDRAWKFEGTFPTADEIESFEPWNKRSKR